MPASSSGSKSRETRLNQLLHRGDRPSRGNTELREARQQSSNRLQQAWESIYDRYEREDHLARGRDDVYDLETGEIVEDGGFLRMCTDDGIAIGAFGLPGAMGMDDTSGDDQDDQEEEDEDDNENEDEDDYGNPTGRLDISSSEDELSNWTPSLNNLAEPSQQYWETRRAKEVLERDVVQFLRKEAARQATKRERGVSLFAPRRLKLESMKPSCFSEGPPISTTSSSSCSSASTTLVRRHSPSKLSRFTPGSSATPERKPSLQGHGSNSSLAKTKPLYGCHSSTGPISATVRMVGGNTILTQAIACEDDSSDDDLTLLSPFNVTPYSIESHSSSVSYNRSRTSTVIQNNEFFPSTPCSISPTRIKRSPSALLQSPIKRSRSVSTPCIPAVRKLEPVVEIFISSSRSHPSLSKGYPAIHSSGPRTLSRPGPSSPLKTSSKLSYYPPSPPLSQASKEVSPEEELATNKAISITSSDSEDELSLARTLVRRKPVTSPKMRRASFQPPSPLMSSLSASAPSTKPSKTNLVKTNHSADPSYYFPDGPPSPSTSAMSKSCQSIKTALKRSPSPFYKRGQEPWRIKRCLPTPPPSQTSESSVSPCRVIKPPLPQAANHTQLWSDAESEDKRQGDIFKPPAPKTFASRPRMSVMMSKSRIREDGQAMNTSNEHRFYEKDRLDMSFDLAVSPRTSRTKIEMPSRSPSPAKMVETIPWNSTRYLPTPSPSQTSEPSLSPKRVVRPSNANRGKKEEKEVSSLLLPQETPRNERSARKSWPRSGGKGKDTHTFKEESTSEEDDILLISQTKPVPMIQSTPTPSFRTPGGWSQLDCSTPVRLRCSSIANTSYQRRSGSVARSPRKLKILPPDDNGEESDDPLAI